MSRDHEKDSAAEKANQLIKMLEALGRSPLDAMNQKKEHKFWSTQPVPKSGDELASVPQDGPIKSERPSATLLASPLPLPEDFEWVDIDINDDTDRSDLYLLLNQNYVEDLDSKFRFDYPANFLEWALKAPGWKKEWHVGVRVKSNRKLVAFISAIPTRFRVRSSEIESVEVNFLCVHKALRAKRLAPVLIKEVTRRVNLAGIYQALYTAGLVLPEPISTTRYYHRPLNFTKLLEAGFTVVPPNKTVSQMKDKYRVSKGSLRMRQMEEGDLGVCHAIFNSFMASFDLVPLFSEEEFRHWVLPREKLLFSYVAEDTDGKITDFVTFYSLPTSVLDNHAVGHINVAYLFYYGVSEAKSLTSLIRAALHEAKEHGFDVFNCVDIMKNQDFLQELTFAIGDGCLHYYLYNWKTSLMKPEQVGVVML